MLVSPPVDDRIRVGYWLETKPLCKRGIEVGEKSHPVAGRLLYQPQGGVAILDPLSGQPFDDHLRPRIVDEDSHLLGAEPFVQRGNIEYLSARRQKTAGRIQPLVSLDKRRVRRHATPRGHHQVEGRCRRLEPPPHPLQRSAERHPPRTGPGPRDTALPSLDHAYGAVRRTQVRRAHDLLSDRVALERPRLAARVALESAAKSAQNPGVVGLDLLVAGGAGEDHLRPAAETGEIVMAHRTYGHQEFGLDRGPVQPQRDPLA